MSKYIYLAGLIDGEGTIGICRDTGWKFRAPYMSVSSTTPEIIAWLKENFGGVVCNHKVSKAHYKPSQSWRIRNKTVLFELLPKIEPYMLEPAKKARIKMLLEEYPLVTIRNGKYTPEQILAKQDFEERFLSTK